MTSQTKLIGQALHILHFFLFVSLQCNTELYQDLNDIHFIIIIFQEIHALKAQLEAAKYDVIKYCIGTLVSISAVGLAVIRNLVPLF